METKKVFSLNHIAIGTRFSGSFSYESFGSDEAEQEWEERFWVNPEASAWKVAAEVGDEFPVSESVYWARVQ